MIDNKILWISVFGALLSGPLYSFAGSWSKTYFTQVYGWSSQDASAPGTLIYMGMVFGGPLIALISERFHNYAKLVTLSGLTMALALLGTMYLKLPFYGAAIFLILIGFFSAYQVLIFSMVTERTPQWLGGTMIGIVNMINMISGIIYPYVFGSLLDSFWEGAMCDNVRFYSEHAFNMGIFSLVAGLLIGAGGFYFIKYDRKASV